ncbi:hypothetical protein LTR08_004615 [Meristemomyces frigidus]|nr:hypothetical protein LTR08_004615 [Meristemomyces frigidus]
MECPVYSVLRDYILQDRSWLTVVRGPIRFIITVHFAKIGMTEWGKKYLRRIGILPQDDDSSPSMSSQGGFDFDMVVAACLPLILELSPTPSIQGLRVEQLCKSPTYHLELVGSPEGDGEGDVRVEQNSRTTYEPSHNLCPVPFSELPTICQGIPRIPASILILATSDGDSDPRAIKNPQGKVLTSDGRAMYFKPRMGEPQFHRELDILNRIKELRLRDESVENRFPDLIGIVVSTDEQGGEMAVGLLMTLISSSPDGADLLRAGTQERFELHEVWKTQVMRMVGVLHEHGLVWGDVNPGNVVIDDASQAWLVDFGGRNNAEFVDDALMETEEGDWQGVGRLFEEWLPRPTYQCL